MAGGVHDDPDTAPEPTAEAPKGWTWNRGKRSWVPKIRGPVLWSDGAAETRDKADEARLQQTAHDLNRDPDPHWMRDSPAPGGNKADDGGSIPFDEIPQDVKDDIAGLGGLIATPVLALARAIDPYCGGALADSFEGVMDATLPLICRSKKIVQYFSDEHNDWLLWGKLAMALAPVAKAITEHHILKTVETVRDEKTGAVLVRRKVKPGEQKDHLQPQAQAEPQYEYAA